MEYERMHILIVEDEVVVALSLKMELEFRGYSVIGIETSGEEAVGAALHSKPDVILMDINLAGHINGLEAARQIAERIQTEFIFISGYSDQKMKQDANRLYPLSFQNKPVTIENILPILEGL